MVKKGCVPSCFPDMGGREKKKPTKYLKGRGDGGQQKKKSFRGQNERLNG